MPGTASSARCRPARSRLSTSSADVATTSALRGWSDSSAELPDDVAGGDAVDDGAIALDASRAGQDDVQLGRGRALAEQLLARLDLLDVGFVGQAAELTFGAPGEQRDTGELVGPGLMDHRAHVRRASAPADTNLTAGYGERGPTSVPGVSSDVSRRRSRPARPAQVRSTSDAGEDEDGGPQRRPDHEQAVERPGAGSRPEADRDQSDQRDLGGRDTEVERTDRFEALCVVRRRPDPRRRPCGWPRRRAARRG